MIRSLNIDEAFEPTSYVAIKFTMTKFSGGEMHIKLDNDIDYSKFDKIIITNRFRNGDDIMKVLIAKDALQRKGVKYFELVMPYIPYARQDRQCDDGESFTLKVFTDLINSAKFDKVYVVDAHSDVAPALINNCVNIPNYYYVQEAYYLQNDGNEVVLISPDSGANKKCNKLFDSVKVFSKFVKCDKKRNVSTGELSGFEVFCDDLKGETCIIVDDICDGGRTFTGIAQELKNKNAGDIYLFVTHGIFSYGTDELKMNFKKIFCTNSFKDITDDLIIQLKITI
jgi:ribose-phosphate pyrophosphokinase